jgi:hypothetical protein
MAAGRLVYVGFMPAIDPDGVPYPDARFTVYQNRTTTLAVIYADEALTTPLANPVLADSSGQFPPVWADDGMLFSASISSLSQPLAETIDDLAPSTSVGGAANKLDRDGGNPEPDFLTNVGAVDKTGDTLSGPLSLPNVWTVTEPTYAPTEGYGLIDQTSTQANFNEGQTGAPITTETYNRPTAYIERHVAGRLSQPPATLTDATLASNWLLTPTQTVVTVVESTGSNAAASAHFYTISETAGGTPPTATNPPADPENPQPGELSQAGINGSVNCLCASVHTVRVNAPPGTKPRSGWAINSEAFYQTGLKPDNLVIMEGDLITTGGGATSCIPAPQNNFTGTWMQSAPRDAMVTRKAGTTAHYVSSLPDTPGSGWYSAMTVRANVFQYGIYLENLSGTTGVAAAGVLVTSGTGLNNWVNGLQTNGGFTQWAANLENGRNAASAGGVLINCARASSDAVYLQVQSNTDIKFYVTGDASYPIWGRFGPGGVARNVRSASLGSLVSGNEVLYLV